MKIVVVVVVVRKILLTARRVINAKINTHSQFFLLYVSFVLVIENRDEQIHRRVSDSIVANNFYEMASRHLPSDCCSWQQLTSTRKKALNYSCQVEGYLNTPYYNFISVQVLVGMTKIQFKRYWEEKGKLD